MPITHSGRITKFREFIISNELEYKIWHKKYVSNWNVCAPLVWWRQKLVKITLSKTLKLTVFWISKKKILSIYPSKGQISAFCLSIYPLSIHSYFSTKKLIHLSKEKNGWKKMDIHLSQKFFDGFWISMGIVWCP